MLVGAICLSVTGVATAAETDLLLDVMINGRGIEKIGEFAEVDGELYATPEELTALGIVVPLDLALDPARPIRLADIPSLRYEVDRPNQRIAIELPISGLVLQRVEAGYGPPPAPAEAVPGATLNYDLLATYSGGQNWVNGLADARVFGSFGVLSSGFLGGTEEETHPITRLDTTWTYSDPDSLRRWQLGDVVSGGLTWTRPLRLGGAQLASDFAMRPDLITFPTPNLRGEIALPSTVDVFVNNVKRLSHNVEPGPFEIDGLPFVTGAGDVSVVVRDALGRETVQLLPFYASSSLLLPGLSSYSIETGAVRKDYGLKSNDYGEAAGSGTLRHGLTDWLTGELHIEASGDVAMGGFGSAVELGSIGVLSAAVAGSGANGKIGTEVALGFEHRGLNFSVGVSTILANSRFRDLASQTADESPPSTSRLILGLPLDRAGSLALSYTMIDGPKGATHQIAAASHSLPLFANAVLVSTAFTDLDSQDSGATFSIAFPFGSRRSASVGASTNNGHWQATSYASQVAPSPETFGWRLFNSQGQVTQRIAEAEFKAQSAQLTAGVGHVQETTSARAGMRGAIIGIDKDVFLANWIDDSFAVVDTSGFSNIDVLFENRPVGQTDGSGKLLVSNLRAYQNNKITIDPLDLPLDAQAKATVQEVNPAERSGVVVNFPAHTTSSATAILVDEAGIPLPLGSKATLLETGAVFPVGYDGQVFLTDLKPTNVLESETLAGHCRASFAFTPQPGDLPTLGELRCERISP